MLVVGVSVTEACTSAEPPTPPPPDAGCSGESPTCPTTPPSYANDVAPIIADRCAPCHAPGGVSSTRVFTTYADVYRYRTSMLTQVYGCRMPPATATPLTSDEKATLLAWLACGAPDN